jgi:hypothetical protein
MPTPVLLPVQFQRVARVRLAERERHRFRGTWNRYQMNVIGHQAPAKNAQVMTERMFTKYGKVADSVCVGEKYVCWRLRRCVTWWATPGRTKRARRGM